jgi:oxalate decarboxylase/phosphoglucose isomerase-like protein (cupin superfamily)
MLDLSTYLGIPLMYDNRKDKLLPSSEVVIGETCVIPLEDVRATLLNKTIKYPDYVYVEYRRMFHKDHEKKFMEHNLKHNLLIIPPNLLGIEFAKTHCYTSPHKVDNSMAVVLECVYGVMTVVLQTRKPRENLEDPAEVFEVGILKAKRGEKVVIPSGYDFTIVNTRSQVSVISKVFSCDYRLDYRTIQKEQGLAYYVIRKNARQENVINPKYRYVPKLNKKVKPADLMKKYKIDHKTSLYEQVLKNPKKFVSLLARAK